MERFKIFLGMKVIPPIQPISISKTWKNALYVHCLSFKIFPQLQFFGVVPYTFQISKPLGVELIFWSRGMFIPNEATNQLDCS